MPLHAPQIDPVIIHLWGPLQIRWYSLLYIGGFLVGRAIVLKLAREGRFQFTPDDVVDLVVPSLLGAVVGARIFYCLFYDFPALMKNPFFIFEVYKGGLSFHGGLVGLMVGAALYAKRHQIPILNLYDAMTIAGTPGLAMGRLGNFINGELWGRTTTVPWGMVFDGGGPLPRHPSQLYELFFEGVVLFSALYFSRKRLKKDGQLSMLFLMCYPVFRFFIEFFREPDAQLGFLALGWSMGQWLCIGMMAFALAGMWVVSHRQPLPTTPKENTFKQRQKKGGGGR